MSITHTLIRSYRDESGTLITGSSTVADDTSLNTSILIALGATVDHEVDWKATRANLKSLMFYASHPVDIYVNDTHDGSPTDHISLTEGQEINWGLVADGLAACPLGSGSATVTKLYITNATIITLTQVATSGSVTTYSYSSYTGPVPAVGMIVTVTGFVTGGNNVTATIVTASGGTSGSFTVAHSTQGDETHAAQGVGASTVAAQVEIRAIAHQGN